MVPAAGGSAGIRIGLNAIGRGSVDGPRLGSLSCRRPLRQHRVLPLPGLPHPVRQVKVLPEPAQHTRVEQIGDLTTVGGPAQHSLVGGALLSRILEVEKAPAAMPGGHVMREFDDTDTVPVQVVETVGNGWSPVGVAAVLAAIPGGDVRHDPKARSVNPPRLPSPRYRWPTC